MNTHELRALTLHRFTAWGLQPNSSLPLLEPVAELRPESAAEVARRAIAAGYVAAASFGAPSVRLRSDLKNLQLWDALGSEEQAFLSDTSPSTKQKHAHGWLIESIHLLAWTLNLVELDHFAPCAPTLAGLLPRAGEDPGAFVASAKLRPLNQLLQEADTLYMLHWAAVEANLLRESNERLVLPRFSFRRHAADWAIGVEDSWDEVSLDT